MQIVIDIPKVFYEALKKTDEMVSGQRGEKTLMSVIYNAVANGTPLPKNHGRLIDADKFERFCTKHELGSCRFTGEPLVIVDYDEYRNAIFRPLFHFAETIIPAEGEE